MGLALMSGCTEPVPTLVFITIEARPAVADVDAIEVLLTNDNATLRETFDVSGGSFPTTFTVTAAGRNGTLALELIARDDDGIEVARGSAEATLIDDERTDAAVLLEPSDFVVNTTIAGSQRLGFATNTNARQLAVRRDGSFAIVWTNDCKQLGRCDEFSRLFDASARPQRNDTAMSADEFLVNQSEVFGQDPAVAVSAATTLVCWFSAEPFDDLWCSAFDIDGAHLDTSDLLITSGSGVADPAIAALADGTFVVVWTESNAADTGRVVRGQLVTEAGERGENPVTNDTGPFPISTSLDGIAETPSVAAAEGSSYVVVWLDDNDVFARFIDESGIPRPNDQVDIVDNTDPLASAWGPQVAWRDGVAVVAWGLETFDTPPFDQGVFRMKAVSPPLGTAVGAEVTVSPTATDPLSSVALTVRSDGVAALAWHDCDPATDGSSCGIVARLFRPTGLPLGDRFVVNTTTASAQVSPSIRAGADDAFVATWTDESEAAPDTDKASVRARIFYPDIDPTDGRLGARCGGAGDASCRGDTVCLPGSDETPYCHAACDPVGPAPQCPGGGVCSTTAGVSGCVL